jgi:HlyD family secretion protein
MVLRNDFICLAITTVLCGGLLLAGCSNRKEEPESERVVSVDVAPVLNSAIRLKVTADAVLYPLQQAAIIPKTSAPVKKFYADRGTHVRAGQLLAELENQDLVGAVMESQAAYEQAEATYQTAARATVPQEVQKAELDVRAATDTLAAQQKIFDSRQELLKQGAISQKDVDDARVNLTQARNQYEIARQHLEALQGFGKDQELKAAAAQRDAAKTRHGIAETQLGYSKITSPIDGVVTDRPLYAGEMASNSTAMITVMDLTQVIARTHISQQEAAQLKVGDTANLLPPEGGAPVPGKVTVISPALDPGGTTVEVWIQAANTGERLKPGTSLRVEAIARTVPSALVIPQAAVLTSPSGNTSVIVVDSENKPHKKSVTLGIREGDNVQVTDGVESGDRVVTAGAFELSKLDEDVLAATKVEVQPPKEEEEDEK